VGRHVQNLLGILSEVNEMRRKVSQSESSRLLVLLDFQADCLAGVWAHDADARKLLEPGDIDEALTAAASLSRDGSSEERARWFQRGYDQGTIDACDMFGAKLLTNAPH